MVSTKEKIELLTLEFTDLTRFSPQRIRTYLRDIMVVVGEVSLENEKLRERIETISGEDIKRLKK